MTNKTVAVAPSMMCADFLHLADELDLFADTAVEWLHMDIMDGAYVPNFTLGPDYCRAVAAHSQIPQDIHMMVEHPDRHVANFFGLPGVRITFHPETVRQPVRLIERIREGGAAPGIAVDPAIPIEHYKHLLPLVDQVCIMTVNPGYAGQKLIPYCIDKIRETRLMIDALGLSTEIEVDGNVSWANIPSMIRAGADILVVGTSSLFSKTEPRRDTMAQLRAATASTTRAAA